MGGGPEMSVIAAVEPAFEPAGAEPFPYNHYVGFGTLWRDRAVNSVSWRGFFRGRFCWNRNSEYQREYYGNPLGKYHF